MDDADYDLWAKIDSGDRDPVEIIYVVEDEPVPQFEEELEEIIDFGEATGWRSIQIVGSVEEAIRTQRSEPAELMVLLNCGSKGARSIAEQFPDLPLAVAVRGGWSRFPTGFPPQVVVAQWAAPRPGDFSSAVEEALSPTHRRLLYEQTHPKISLYRAASDELLARLSQYPLDRFQLDPRVFEEAVASLLEKMGYSVYLTPQSGDLGRDIIATISTPVSKLLMLVECKRFSPHRLVTPEPITRIWTQVNLEKANMGLVVTTSGFRRAALRTAKDLGYQMSLKDGDEFIKWIHRLKSS